MTLGGEGVRDHDATKLQWTQFQHNIIQRLAIGESHRNSLTLGGGEGEGYNVNVTI